MGQCPPCGSGGRLPSALQLCEAVEQARTARAQQAASSSHDRALSPAGQIGESIWHYLTKEEVKSLCSIVERWSKGKLSGSDARQEFRLQVLRGQTQQAVELQNASSAFVRAGVDGALAGLALGSQAMGQAAASQAARTGPGGSPAGPSPLGQGFFGAVVGGIFGGLHSALRGGHTAFAQTQNVFAQIDNIFAQAAYEEAFRIAMEQLKLDGPKPLPGEVQVTFQQRVSEILESAPRQQAANASRLDLVMLCLCTEVIRHPKASPSSRGFSATVAPPAGRSSSSQASEHQSATQLPESSPGPSDGQPRAGWPQGDMSGQIGSPSVSPGNDPTAFRVDPDFLRDRIFVLIESILGMEVMNGQPAGLSMEDMDKHCPVGARQTAAEDDHCPICLERCLVGEAVRILPCKHELHRECCEAWLSTASTCPTCRFEIDPS